jgi:hypothetical protein
VTVRYFIRLGETPKRGPYVRTYAGGDVTTTFNRWAALSWTDRDLVHRLAVAIRRRGKWLPRVTVLRTNAARNK